MSGRLLVPSGSPYEPIAGWDEVARAHGEVFGAVRPASTFVVVAGLLDPRWRVELEADAVVGGREAEEPWRKT